MKYLVIVESPSKCKKIEKILNENDDLNIYEVVATMGHINELKSLKSIDIQNHFTCNYEPIEAKRKNTEAIRKKIPDFDEVILCCDPDREGEGIAASICQTFHLDIKTTKRVTFNEITETAIITAIQSPRTINLDLVHAQQSRQILDLLVGFKVTPTLWKCITKHASNSLSAGRCQTPALRIIYDNQQDINNEEPKKVYNTTGYFTGLNIPFELNKQFETDKEITDFLIGSITHSHTYSCSAPNKVCKKQPEPFSTSRIQQVASNELHFSPKETMQLCQSLYEAGYITYMRTDSKSYSKEFIENVKDYILRNYKEGEKYIRENIDEIISGERSCENDLQKNNTANAHTHAQEAHEAIRPTNISLYDLPEKVNSREKRMYKLIWTNTLESCMSSAFFYAITAAISGYNKTAFKYTCEQVCFPGWLIVTKKYKEDIKEYKYLQMLKQNDTILYKKICAKVSVKGLKHHFSEAHLIQLLEEKGIGRPSTFSSLVEKIQEREYVKKKDIQGKKISCKDYELEDGEIVFEESEREFGNEKNKLVIQPLGIIVMEFLDKHFFSLFNYDYTKEMEDALDKIAKGELLWEDVCEKCNKQIDSLIEELKDEKKMEIQIDDSHSYIIGKYGPVVKHTEQVNGKEKITFKAVKPDIDIHEIEKGDITLENIVDANAKKKQYVLGQHDGEDVIIKKGKFGLYITWGENTKTLKDLGNRPIENITFDEVKKYLEEGSNVVRKINDSLCIRKGAANKPDYLFYKTPKMRKPIFYDLTKFFKDTKEDYKSCDERILKTWIQKNYTDVK